MMERKRKNDGKKEERQKKNGKGWIDKRKNMEKKRQKKNTSCIINLL